MIRTLIVFSLVLLLAGCTRFQSRAQGPFARTPKPNPPPPYGAVAPPKPVGNQSPLGIASADPTQPLPPEDTSIVPPRPDALQPAGAFAPATDAGGFPPFKRRPEPKPGSLPSPFAPKDPAPVPQDAPKKFAELKSVLATAVEAWQGVKSYEATLTRREVNPQKQLNKEVLFFQFRKEPMSVYTLNTSDNGKGRETIYYPTKHGDKLYIKLGKGDPFPGIVAPPISPDDKRVTEKARYSIRTAGFGTPIGKLNRVLAKMEAGQVPADALVYDGPVRRDEYSYPLIGVTHNLRPGDDPLFPKGGTKRYFFDMKPDSPSRGLPVLVFATDASGKEVEYYLFDKLKVPATVTDADFDPARRKK